MASLVNIYGIKTLKESCKHILKKLKEKEKQMDASKNERDILWRRLIPEYEVKEANEIDNDQVKRLFELDEKISFLLDINLKCDKD